MTSDAQVLIIGGGAMGVSLMYHLVKAGWTDVILTEKNDLTHGSTWHAAGLCTHFAHNPTIQELRATSVRLYRDILPAETGESCGFHPSGAMRITSNPERMAEFAHVAGLSKFTGYELRLLNSPEEVAALHPLARTGGIIGGIYEPDDGHVDPTLATNAMARVARQLGAVILRRNPVLGIRRENGVWAVETRQGLIRAQHIVNAAGTWGFEIGRMMGANVPSVPVLHQYLVTDSVQAVADRIKAGLPELPMIRDPEESWYVRQERDALILGPYEKEAQVWSVDGVPPEFGAELMEPDLDRVEHILMAAMARIPALETGGVKSVVNGPITFTPDANPLIGPAWGLENAWLLTGSSMGVMEGGGSGWFLAHWMTHGAPPMDALAVDSRRFGPWADRDYRVAKAIECFGLQFGVHYPHEERPAARGKRRTPLYDLMLARGAQMGAAYGWERPNWFGAPARLTFGRPDWFDSVAGECRMVTSGAGLADMSVFSKFEVTGKDARAFVDALGCNLAPKPGRVGLTYALTQAGGTESEFTLACLAEDHFYLTSAAAAEMRDDDLLRARMPGFDIEIRRVSDDFAVIALMGPAAPAILARLSQDPLGPWMSVRQITVAGIATRALRLSYIGEAGWELHVPAARAAELFLALEAAGQPEGIGCFGSYAMNAMRLEKGYPAWGSDFTTERTPAETGMGFLVKPDHDFPGREALMARMADPKRWEMVLLEVEPGAAEPYYSHSVWQGTACIGVVTSAATGHRTGKVLALAWLRDRQAKDGLEVEILGTRRKARILERPPFDPDNLRLRGAG
ncbi:GcvT family protein [Pseudogemmobacter bohemicus]|uniref:GcvT family protein n=1 Tax=Pseudogemmobacter bohemicus TaxID=2250708 RepID=UPI000DD48292|nr:FAD-dependent oxidoreductase [Pseudogemmobacter bohemicus]